MRAPHTLAMTLLLAAGCGASFDPASVLQSVRLLAVESDPPEVGPGATAMLRVLHFPGADVTPEVTTDWSYCTLYPVSGSSDPVNVDCIQNDTAAYLVPLGAGESTSVTMPALDLRQAGLPDATGGFYLPIRARVRGHYNDHPDNTDTGIYRLRYHIPGLPLPPNQNPGFDLNAGADGGMSLDEGTNRPIRKNESITLRARFVPGSAEMYPTIKGDPRDMMFQMVSEALEVRWYSSAGTLLHESTGPDEEQQFTLTDDTRLPAVGGRIDLYAVGRDDRGGTAWVHGTLIVAQ